MIKAVLFDLDSTLADTRDANAIAYTCAFQEAEINFTAGDYYKYHGRKWDDWGPKLAGFKASSIHQRKQTFYFELLDKIHPIEATISQWRYYKDRCVCILVTNASRHNAKQVLDLLDISFDYEFFGEDYNDSKELLKHIISFIAVDSAQVLLIDDSQNRLTIAAELGMKTQKVEI